MSRHKGPPPRKEAPPSEEDRLWHLALDRLAQSVHPELLLALQEHLPERDWRWLLLFTHGFDDDGKPLSPLLIQPVALRPVTWALDGARGDNAWVVQRLCGRIAAWPERLEQWRARVSYVVVTSLGEARCAALGRDGMGEVIGLVEGATLGAAQSVLVGGKDDIPVDAQGIGALAMDGFAAALANARLGRALQLRFPDVDDEEIDNLVHQATAGLEFRAGAAPAFEVELRAAGKPWLPLQSVQDALSRRLGGGLRVLG